MRAVGVAGPDRGRRPRRVPVRTGRRPPHPRHEQPGRVQQPRPSASGAWSRRSASRPSSCASSPRPGARSRARELAEALLEKSGFDGGRVFFTLAGADANENAVKFARQARGMPRGQVDHARPLLPRRQLRRHGAVRRRAHAAARSTPKPFGVLPRAAAVRLPLPVRQRATPTPAASARPRPWREAIDRARRATRSPPC